MDFQLSSDQKMLRDTVRSFTKQQSTLQRFRELREAGSTWDAKTWAHMGELGWLSVPFPESVGGFDGTFFDVAIVLEGFGATLVPEPYIPSVVAGLALLEAGDAAQHERFLAPMIEGRTVLSLAHAERNNRFGPQVRETHATPDGDGYRLQGTKTFVLAGDVAHHFVVSALLDGAAALFVVDRDDPGVSVTPVATLDANGAAIVTLDARVDADRRLVQSDAAEVIDRALDHGAAASCAESVGIGQAVLDMTIEHLKTREQFGKPIGTFQVLQHDAVDMFVQLELMKSMSILAAGSVGGSGPASERRGSVSAAKAHVARSGRALTQAAIQLHGGIGITEEHDVGLYFKRMHALSLMFGDADHHTRRFSAQPDWAE